jgi:hypothetical protein
MTTQTPATARTLDVFEVLEEEYAHLHPGAARVANDRQFTADQVRDAASLARILCEAMQRRDHLWESSPAHSVALYVLQDAPGDYRAPEGAERRPRRAPGSQRPGVVA